MPQKLNASVETFKWFVNSIVYGGLVTQVQLRLSQKTLEEIEGVSNVSVDLDAKKAFFDADTSQLIDKAIKDINEAGYKASNN